MWMEELSNGKFKYFERYNDPLSEKSKRVSVTLKSKSRQAEKKASQILNERIAVLLETTSFESVTFDRLSNEFWKKYPHTVKGSTALRQKHNFVIVKKHIKDDTVIKNLKTKNIQDVLDTIYYTDNYSLSTVRQCRSLLRQMFQVALKSDYIESNPVENIEIIAKPKNYEEVEKINNKYLEHDELKLLIDHLSKNFRNKRLALMVEFLALTGLRFGELIALRYDNFMDNSILVDGTIDYATKKASDAIKTTTKTKASVRKVLLSERAIEIIELIISENQLIENNNSGTIFCSYLGNPFDLPNFNRSFQKAAKECGIKKDVSSHILRHTHISILAELGVDLKTIMNRVGHSKPETTLAVYTHVTNKMQENMMDKLNTYII